jgi:5'-nucleotidase
VKRVAVAAQGQRDQSVLRVEERQDARGRTYFWIGFKRIFSDPQPGTDLRAMYEGAISVTPLHLNLTDLKEHQRLSALIDGPVKALKTKAKPPARKLKPVVEDTDAVPTRFRRADDK